MSDSKINIRDAESGIDEEQGQGMALLFTHSYLVLTSFCR